MESEIEKRGPGRPRREESSIRSTPIRERKRKGGQVNDKFHIDASAIPDCMSYEWKTHTVTGKEDAYYSSMLRDQGWDPVDASRHPEMVSSDYRGPIIREGLMLCERPIELTLEAQAEDRANALDVIRTKKQQMGEAPVGTLPREAPNLRNYARQSYEALPIDN